MTFTRQRKIFRPIRALLLRGNLTSREALCGHLLLISVTGRINRAHGLPPGRCFASHLFLVHTFGAGQGGTGTPECGKRIHPGEQSMVLKIRLKELRFLFRRSFFFFFLRNFSRLFFVLSSKKSHQFKFILFF